MPGCSVWIATGFFFLFLDGNFPLKPPTDSELSGYDSFPVEIDPRSFQTLV